MSDILFVTPSYTPFVGGARAFLESFGQRLAADGHSVTVLTTTARRTGDFWQPPGSSRSPLPARETLGGVRVERLSLMYPWPAPYTFGVLRRASYWIHRSGLPAAVQQRLLESLSCWMPPVAGLQAALAELTREADLVQAVDSSWDGLFTAAARCARRYGKPFVAMPLMHLGDANVDSRFQMVHQVTAYRGADAVLALSEREAMGFVELGVAEENVHTVHMGVDPKEQRSSQGKSEFRRDHGLGGPLVAFLGAQTRDKGAFTLVEAVARLNQDGLGVQLVCAGPESERLEAFVQNQPQEIRHVLRDQMRVLGVVTDRMKHQLLAACDVLALPSRVDTFGIVLLEAGLHGKPVIGADAGGIPEVVDPGNTGLLVPFGDVSALADAIRKVVTNQELATRLGEAGRERVLQEYTWDRTYRSLLEIYGTVL